MSIMRNMLNIVIILCVYLNLGCTEGAQESESGKVDSHTIQVNSLWPSSSSCIPSSKVSNTKSSLRVVHKYGACSPLGGSKEASLDYDDIITQDQARVDFIHSKSSKKFANRLSQSKSTDLPVKDESHKGGLGTGNYLVAIGIGTPKQYQSLIIDTGSDLTWTKCGRFNTTSTTNSCKSCKTRHCAKSCKSIMKPIFNPFSSTSFKNIPSHSPACSNDMSSTDLTYQRGNCLPPRCCYEVTYEDKSYSKGFLAKDKFTLTSSDDFDDIYFGCGEVNGGIPIKTDGVLGLSRQSLSFPSQTATTYDNIFSYCLPSSASYTGHLTFGSTGISESVKYTPIRSLERNPKLYGLDLVGITVGGKKLEIPTTVFAEPGFIIDWGTVITRLPPKAYAVLRSAFREQMKNYKMATKSVDKLMDTCYHHSAHHTIVIPKVSLSFGSETTVEIDSKGILYQVKDSYLCLAFAANQNDYEVAIFGSFQQMTLQVVYDNNAGGQVGFAPNGCN